MNITERASAYAKINLALFVGNKIPPRGFHALESVFVRLNLHDDMIISTSISENANNQISINCKFDQRLSDHLQCTNQNQDELKSLIEGKEGILANTCERILESYSGELANLDIKIDLVKSIPLEAGLGGGSADAATVLNFFSKHYNLYDDERIKIAEGIGFDVTPCLYHGPSFSCYNGQHHTRPLYYPEASSRRYALLLKPPLGSNTSLAYQALGRSDNSIKNPSSRISSKQEEKALLDRTFINCRKLNGSVSHLIENDFQDSVFKEIPELERILLDLHQYSPVVSGLAGSGSSIFSLFSDYKTALKAYLAMSILSEKGWFIAISQILSL